MIKRVIGFFLVLILTLSFINVVQADSVQGTIWGGWLILRDAPSYNGKNTSSYPAGTVVTITGKDGLWYAVKTPDGKQGYMYSKWLKISGNESGLIPSGQTVYVTSKNGANVRLRTGPATSYPVRAAYAPGTEAIMIDYGKNWSMIQIGDFQGYMMSTYLTTKATPVPTPQPSTEYTVYVTSNNGKGVYMRSGPSKGYSSIGFYNVGTSATMVSKGNTWSYIRIGMKSGYMMTQYLSESAPYNPSPIVGSPVVYSRNGKNVNLRSGPGQNYSVITSFPVGTSLSIISRGTTWYYISIGSYRGYMMREYIKENGSYTPAYHSELRSCTLYPAVVPYPGFCLQARVNDDAAGEYLTYRWLRDGYIDLNCADSQYIVTNEDIGHRLSCVVSAKTENGATVQVTSAQTDTVAAYTQGSSY